MSDRTGMTDEELNAAIRAGVWLTHTRRAWAAAAPGTPRRLSPTRP